MEITNKLKFYCFWLIKDTQTKSGKHLNYEKISSEKIARW